MNARAFNSRLNCTASGSVCTHYLAKIRADTAFHKVPGFIGKRLSLSLRERMDCSTDGCRPSAIAAFPVNRRNSCMTTVCDACFFLPPLSHMLHLPHHLIPPRIALFHGTSPGMVDGKLRLYNRTSAKEGTLAGSMGGFLFREASLLFIQCFLKVMGPKGPLAD